MNRLELELTSLCFLGPVDGAHHHRIGLLRV